MFGLAVLILIFGPVSGAHFNPAVSAADWLLGRRAGTGLTGREAVAYIAAQVVGGVAGAVLANAMFDLPAGQISTKDRLTVGHGLGEIVATAGLVLLIFALARTGRAALSAAAVGAYIGAAYWFTSSTSFANPAVTDRPDVHRHVRRHRPSLRTVVHRRATGRRRGRPGRGPMRSSPTPRPPPASRRPPRHGCRTLTEPGRSPASRSRTTRKKR